MVFNTGAALLDAIVLSVVSRDVEGTYGYKITQDVRQVIELSESTLYPVLRRLQKDGFLTTYDQPYQGRNRRYYHITEAKDTRGKYISKGNQEIAIQLAQKDYFKKVIKEVIEAGNIYLRDMKLQICSVG